MQRDSLLTQNKDKPYNFNKSKIILDDSRNLEFAGKKIIDELANTIPNDNQSIISEIPNSRIVSSNKYIFIKIWEELYV